MSSFNECLVCGADSSLGEAHDEKAHRKHKLAEIEENADSLDSRVSDFEARLNRLENCLIDLAKTAQHEEITKSVLFRFLKSYKVVK